LNVNFTKVEITMSKRFYEYWGDKVLPGKTYTMDPNENVLTLEISSNLDNSVFQIGGFAISKFYRLEYEHFFMFNYAYANCFDIRIFNRDVKEFKYLYLNV